MDDERAENADDEVTLVLTRSQMGVVSAAVRQYRRREYKKLKSLDRKFGGDAEYPTHRLAALEGAYRRISKVMD